MSRGALKFAISIVRVVERRNCERVAHSDPKLNAYDFNWAV